jgi:hypothetical protein
MGEMPRRQVRASYDDRTITVYQAYSREIADAAVGAQAFVAPFKLARMTWVKPSFLWMMYRCGWATKPGQERVLAIRVRRPLFDAALTGACLSHYDRSMYESVAEWELRKKQTHVRVQWDPERDLDLRPLSWRSLQVGISGPVVRDYASEWIESIEDVTALARDINLLRGTDPAAAMKQLPSEVAYELSPVARKAVGVS